MTQQDKKNLENLNITVGEVCLSVYFAGNNDGLKVWQCIVRLRLKQPKTKHGRKKHTQITLQDTESYGQWEIECESDDIEQFNNFFSKTDDFQSFLKNTLKKENAQWTFIAMFIPCNQGTMQIEKTKPLYL